MADCIECPLFLLLKTLLSEDPEQFYDHNISRIKQVTAIQTGLTVQQLESPSRKPHIVSARKIAMKRCREIGITYKRIGDSFNRSHSTVMYSMT